MKIELLLEKYFEGNTSHAEEIELQKYFAQKNIPESLESYRPLFTYMGQQAERAENRHSHAVTFRAFLQKKKHIFLYGGISAIAACLSLFIGFQVLLKENSLPKNYVMIDGQCYTDEDVIRQYALASLSDVTTNEDEIFNTLFNEDE